MEMDLNSGNLLLVVECYTTSPGRSFRPRSPKFLTSGGGARPYRTRQGHKLTPNMSKLYLLLIHVLLENL